MFCSFMFDPACKNTKNRAVGVLLGSWKSPTNLDIANSFAVPFEEDEKNPGVWFIDHDFLASMFAMFRKVNGKLVQGPVPLEVGTAAAVLHAGRASPRNRVRAAVDGPNRLAAVPGGSSRSADGPVLVLHGPLRAAERFAEVKHAIANPYGLAHAKYIFWSFRFSETLIFTIKKLSEIYSTINQKLALNRSKIDTESHEQKHVKKSLKNLPK